MTDKAWPDVPAKKHILPTFPIPVPGIPGQKPKEIYLTRPVIIWLVVITVLLVAQTAYLVKKNLDASRGIIVNPPPIITNPEGRIQ